MKVINFFGAPGAGKSTAAAGLFHQLKRRWVRSELTSEFAKELVWSDSAHMLSQQNLVFANQESRLHRLRGKIDVAISDAPLLLSAFYAPRHYPLSFKQLVFDFFETYDNLNIVIRRGHSYAADGRLQDEAQSDAIAQAMEAFLMDHGVPFHVIVASDDNPAYLCHWLKDQGHVVFPPKGDIWTPDDAPPPGWVSTVNEPKLALPKPMAFAKHYLDDWIRTV